MSFLKLKNGVLLRSVIMASVTLPASMVWAESFRYKDENGKWVYTKQVPSEFIRNGYEVLSDGMRVIRKVPRAKTKEEIAAIEAARLEKAEKIRVIEEQEKADRELLSRYMNVDGLELARKRKVDQLKGKMSILRGNANGARQEIENLQAEAAALERKGKKVPKKIVEKLVEFKAAMLETNELIAEREKDIDAINEGFDKERERFIYLTSDN